METLFAFELEKPMGRSKNVVKINATVQIVCNIFHSLFRESLAWFELVGLWDLEHLLPLLISQTTDQLFLLVIPPNNYVANSKLTTWRWQFAYELMVVTTSNMFALTGDLELNYLNFNCEGSMSEIGNPECLLLFSLFKTVLLYLSLFISCFITFKSSVGGGHFED